MHRRAAPLPTEGRAQALAEPIYGDVYLPRKFKIGVAWPGDNCVDVLANDVGARADPERRR